MSSTIRNRCWNWSSLNPYYIGRYSMRSCEWRSRRGTPRSLNPYYIGRYSMSIKFLKYAILFFSLNPYYIGRYSMSYTKCNSHGGFKSVLILIILEDTLWVQYHGYSSYMAENGLNPYYIGRYSMRIFNIWPKIKNMIVLILIILEDTLWGR